MKKVIIVIPVHKPNPTPNELASLEQCYKVLGKHPITIVAPSGLDMSAYSDKVAGCLVTFIEPNWMADIRQYNKLKISKYFYDLFKDYEYLLTYELDAWVFRDDLNYWCDKGYDYIGAPWFEGYGEPSSFQKLIGVGNSGFSLRCIKTIRRIWRRLYQIESIRIGFKIARLHYFFKLQSILRLFNFHFHLKSIRPVNEIMIQNHEGVKEDGFWGEHIPKVFTDFRVAPVDEAMHFSFEVNPRQLYDRCNKALPFGCHAWEKYDPVFWKEFINIENGI